jgi:hypothetical protein
MAGLQTYGKVKRWLCVGALFSAVSLAGCHERIETEKNHIVHSGELATLELGSRPEIAVAIDRKYVHILASAVSEDDQAKVHSLVAAQYAAMVAQGTHVHVKQQSFNERRVRIEEGPLAGAEVWVPFEWLKPVARPTRWITP